MKIENNEFTVTNKKAYIEIRAFKENTVKKVFDFAYEMSYGQGEHRKHRSGGDIIRKNGEIFINTFQGKLAELAIYNEFFNLNKEVFNRLSQPDFDVYGLGKWDDMDLSLGKTIFSIKSTKYYGNLLLLETKDWDENAQYIPNLKIGETSHYDYIILVRVAEDGESIMKSNGLLYSNEVDKERLFNIIKEYQWGYDIPGYITHNDLINIIRNKQIIPKGALLNVKTTMDAENYYEETGKLKDFFELVKKLK
ncbi:hypothetical protein [Aliarcobacter skirrowii]|uniref:Uncharacterized protein n=1 Tax=Aliarcobacter skirrowii TaxID=28200 RepID=A0AAW9DAX9_9BACT|nr:hypothetical protein [Aliarcobacter skirrowii]MDX4069244.1 hypothetical protein [Aliarcobacter skirrowii]